MLVCVKKDCCHWSDFEIGGEQTFVEGWDAVFAIELEAAIVDVLVGVARLSVELEKSTNQVCGVRYGDRYCASDCSY